MNTLRKNCEIKRLKKELKDLKEEHGRLVQYGLDWSTNKFYVKSLEDRVEELIHDKITLERQWEDQQTVMDFYQDKNLLNTILNYIYR